MKFQSETSLPISPTRFAFDTPAKLSQEAWERKDYPEALRQILIAHNCNPNLVEFPATAAVILHEMNRYQEALEWHKKTLQYKIRKPEIYYNIGSTFLALNDMDSAIFYTQKSIKEKPTPMAYNNLGNIFIQLQNFGKAKWAFDKAIQMDDKFYMAHFNLGNLLLLYGQHNEGWEEYDYRLLVDLMNDPKSQMPWSYWDGAQNLNGRKLYIEAEQGSGDTFQFARYLHSLHVFYPDCQITFHVPGHLQEFMQRHFSHICNVVSGQQVFPAEAFDYKLKLLSLARVFFNGPRHYNIPYLYPKVGGQKSNGAFHVGLCWQGNPNHKNDINRSMSLDAIFNVVWDQTNKNKDVIFWNLQKDYVIPEQMCEWLHSINLGDWDQTAEIINALDLVITVDTSVAHLAAAMGKEVWLMVPKSPDWRWGLSSEKTLWYPSVKIYRQALRGIWDDVIENVSRDLSARLMG